jgi:hypothetical protein
MIRFSFSKILTGLAVGLSIVAIQGCSKTMEGEVFLVDPKGVSERLSLVKIYQLSVNQVEQFRQALDATSKQIELDLKSATSKVDLNELEKQLQLIDAANERSKSVMQQCIARRGHLALCTEFVQGLAEAQVDVDEAVRKKLAQIAVSFKEVEGTPSTSIALIAREAESFAEKHNITPTKTNSEGKFSLQITAKDNRLLAVPESEQVKSHSVWLIDGSQTEKELILSNDNRVGKNCKECVTLDVASETKKIIEQTQRLVHCYKSLTEYSSYPCKSKEFVDIVRKLKAT